MRLHNPDRFTSRWYHTYGTRLEPGQVLVELKRQVFAVPMYTCGMG